MSSGGHRKPESPLAGLSQDAEAIPALEKASEIDRRLGGIYILRRIILMRFDGKFGAGVALAIRETRALAL